MVVQVLADEGVDTIFGYSGGAILPTYDAIFVHNQDAQRHGQRMPLIVPANEQGAGFMASGYGRMARLGLGATLVAGGLTVMPRPAGLIVAAFGLVPLAANGLPETAVSAPVSALRAKTAMLLEISFDTYT